MRERSNRLFPAAKHDKLNKARYWIPPQSVIQQSGNRSGKALKQLKGLQGQKVWKEHKADKDWCRCASNDLPFLSEPC